MTLLENHFQSIGFDTKTGALSSLFCKSENRELLCGSSLPLALWHTPTSPVMLPHKNYIFDVLPSEPEECYRTSCGFVLQEIGLSEDTLCCTYLDNETGLSAHLCVKLEGVRSTWRLRIENTGGEARHILPVFPQIGPVGFSRETGKMVVLNQSGQVGDLWAHRGGAYGVAFHSSAQFGCMFEGDSCLGFYIADAAFGPKDIRYACPSLSVRWFRGAVLAPGASLTLPDAVFMVYGGSWKQTAAAYGDWFRETVKPPAVPDWVRYADSYTGAWAGTNAPENEVEAQLIIPMDSFEELPKAFRQRPFEVLEYAFYCERSMRGKFYPSGAPEGAVPRRHTDGVNIIRQDLGGAEALKKGVEAAHRMGRRVILYIEGLIVPKDGTLFERIPSAKDWIVHNMDGGNEGPYTGDGWLHMCPGSTEWQDHLAETAARLIRETDIDGIRLDSLGAYHWHCYNPAHKHNSPYDYNLWLSALLEKVARAARAVKADILLSTEHAVDLCYAHFNHALHQIIRTPDLTWAADSAAPLRVALPDYKICYWGGGGVPGSLQLMPDGYGATDTECGRLNECWKNIRTAAAETLADGDMTLPDPAVSRADARCRWVRGHNEDVLIGARPVTDAADPRIEKQREMFLLKDEAETSVSVPLGYDPAEAYLYDIEKQTLSRLPFVTEGGGVRFVTLSRWYMAVFTRGVGPLPAILSAPEYAAAGERISVKVLTASGKPGVSGRIDIPDMEGVSAVTELPGSVDITIPENTPRGSYFIRLSGDGVRTVRRILRVGQVPSPHRN